MRDVIAWSYYEGQILWEEDRVGAGEGPCPRPLLRMEGLKLGCGRAGLWRQRHFVSFTSVLRLET